MGRVDLKGASRDELIQVVRWRREWIADLARQAGRPRGVRVEDPRSRSGG